MLKAVKDQAPAGCVRTHSKQLVNSYGVMYETKSFIPRCMQICQVTGLNEDGRYHKGKLPRDEKEISQKVGSAGISDLCQMLSWLQEESEKDPEEGAKPLMEFRVPSKCLCSLTQTGLLITWLGCQRGAAERSDSR